MRGQKRTGCAQWYKDHYRVRLSLPDGTRPSIHLDPGLTEDGAKDRAVALTAKAWAGKAKYTPKRGPNAPSPPAGLQTIKALTEKWLELIETDPDLAPATKAMHKTNANAHIVPKFERMTVEQLRSGCPSSVDPRATREVRRLDGAQHLQHAYQANRRRHLREWITVVGNPARIKGVRDKLPLLRHLRRSDTSRASRPCSSYGRRRHHQIAACGTCWPSPADCVTARLVRFCWNTIDAEQG